jgi:nitrogen fixation/metabolism regulation signal transduction histidine kinase
MTKASRWALIISAVATAGVALVLLYLLSLATDSRGLYERHYVWLFWVNVVVATILLAVIGSAAVRLVVRLRRGKFGSRLLFKLAAIFALVGVVPGALIYVVSFQFVSRSIETWFDARVEGALEAGLALGRGALDAQTEELATKTRIAAERLAERPSRPRALELERLREQLAAQELALVGANGRVLLAATAPSGAGGTSLTPSADRPGAEMLRQARDGQVTTRLEGIDEEGASGGAPPVPPAPAAAAPGAGAAPGADPMRPGATDPAGTASGAAARIRALAYIPSGTVALGAEERYLMATQVVPREVIGNALLVQAAYREYQQRALARDGLRQMYFGTLTLTLVLAVFIAVLLAVLLGNQLARPLLLLADGVRQVSQGDLGAKPVFRSRDELGGLTRSFADMTEQLSEARRMVQLSVSQVESARANLQTILDNLTAGVLVFDAQGRIDTVNPGATRIVRQPLSAWRGQPLSAVPGLEAFAEAIERRFEAHRTSPEAGERDHWQDSFELPAGSASGPRSRDVTTLLVRGAQMPQGARLVVFDDITDVVSAQRTQAWGEVARRLAHEIKNPLTPIQLSAERLQRRLEDKLEGNDQAVLERSVSTIVNQVQAMKTLVDEFRDYARLPAAQLAPLDLNGLVQEVLGLYAGDQEAGRLAAQLEPGLPDIEGDASQLRQVIHNLVQNGLDAVAERPDGRVRVLTEAQRDAHGRVQTVRLRVVDNGPGVPESVLKRAFEPYVTTKTKGTGLGLAVVKKIADEHAARVRLGNLPADAAQGGAPGGAQVSISFSKLSAVDHAAAAASRPAHGEHSRSG